MSEAGRFEPPAIELSAVALGYGGKPTIKDLTWTIRPGSMTALVGPNGGGKSTLLKGIAGELKPLAGRIRLGRGDHRSIAYLPQSVDFDRSFPILVRDVVGMGLWTELGPFSRVSRRHAESTLQALRAVSLVDFERKLIGELSGGELQKVLFARLITMNAPVILLDEPFAALDQATVAMLLSIITEWHHQGRTIVAALHDFDRVRTRFPETLKLFSGGFSIGPTEEILFGTEEHPPAIGALT